MSERPSIGGTRFENLPLEVLVALLNAPGGEALLEFGATPQLSEAYWISLRECFPLVTRLIEPYDDVERELSGSGSGGSRLLRRLWRLQMGTLVEWINSLVMGRIVSVLWTNISGNEVPLVPEAAPALTCASLSRPLRASFEVGNVVAGDVLTIYFGDEHTPSYNTTLVLRVVTPDPLKPSALGVYMLARPHVADAERAPVLPYTHPARIDESFYFALAYDPRRQGYIFGVQVQPRLISNDGLLRSQTISAYMRQRMLTGWARLHAEDEPQSAAKREFLRANERASSDFKRRVMSELNAPK